MKYDKRLEARVKAANRANAYANELYDKLVPIFKPLVGTKIEKVAGGLLNKVEKQLPDFPSGFAGDPVSVYKNFSTYSLSFQVKTSESVDGIAYYYDANVYIGDVRDGVLTKLYDPPKFKTDYTAADVSAKREAFKKAEKVFDDAKSALFPFGEYDR